MAALGRLARKGMGRPPKEPLFSRGRSMLTVSQKANFCVALHLEVTAAYHKCPSRLEFCPSQLDLLSPPTQILTFTGSLALCDFLMPWRRNRQAKNCLSFAEETG
jgi:hypothetical protein